MLSAVFASRELWDVIGLSVAVSLSATAAAAVIGLPAGAALAVWRFPGRRLRGGLGAQLGYQPLHPAPYRSRD